MIKIKIIQQLSQYIFRNYNESNNESITFWITKNLINLENSDIELSRDEIFDIFADETTKEFSKLIKELASFINCQKTINRIILLEESDGYYLSLNELGKKTNLNIANTLREKIKIIEKKERMDKGIFYENFCSCFLEDLGLESETTKASGDKGIDIKAKYKTKLKQEFSNLVFNDSIYLLAQAKFFMTKADTPILRKLLGDSILIQFDEFDYIEIAHNAFHLLVFSHSGFTNEALVFAEKRKIMTMDTEQIISIIASSNDAIEWKSYNYLVNSTLSSPLDMDHFL